MTDYLETRNLDEDEMNAEYRAAEEAYREEAGRVWDKNEEIKASIRHDLNLTPDERLDAYQQRYERDVAPRFNEAATRFVSGIMGPRGEDERRLSEGVGEKFADHLIALTGKSTEELGAIMQTAQRTGQGDLVRAVAQVALDKNAFGIFDRWAESEPELAAALQRLRTTPGPDQLATRTGAMRPPVADITGLTPNPADVERVRSAEAARLANKQRDRQRFFGYTRQAGRYSGLV